VLLVFLKLGLTSFGGPLAHIAYFREEFVRRRAWLDERVFADLVGLCQFLPGPASSQTGFAIGLVRAGYLGAAAAWAGFTLPSAIVMTLFAYGAARLAGPLWAGALHGLKLVAVAVIAQAVLGMARASAGDRAGASIALVAALIVLVAGSGLAQIGAVGLGALAGLLLCRRAGAPTPGPILTPVSKRVGLAAASLYLAILLALPILGGLLASPALALFSAFYRSGALVFGGGHVVLPLLRQAFVAHRWITDNAFLAGYGAAQALPGPLFTFAAYLGVAARPSLGLAGAALGIVGIFAPGLLILIGALPFWGRLRNEAAAQAAMRGVNASVVGLLAATLYTPVWTSSVRTPADLAVALGGFALLAVWRNPPVLAVALSGLAGAALAAAGLR